MTGGFLNNVRYNIESFVKGMFFFRRIKNEAVRQLLGHTKIIGWEGSNPVRSLSIPAEYSLASAKSTARLYNSLRSGIQYPGLASLSITNRCNCSCSHCFAYNQPGNDLSTQQWHDVIKQSMDLGVFSFTINGGEPLLRDDLPDIISAIDQNRATCNLYTNGDRLAVCAADLYRAGLRRVSVAMDYADPKLHDENRGCSGLFDRVIKGLKAAQSCGMLVAVSTFVDSQRFKEGVLERIFEFAAQLKVNEIIVYDTFPAGRLSDKCQLKTKDPEYDKELYDFMQSWWKKKTAPGIWWYKHISSFQNLGCSGGTSMFNVSHCGDFRPCDFCRQSVGSVLDEDLQRLWIKLRKFALKQREIDYDCLVLRA